MIEDFDNVDKNSQPSKSQRKREMNELQTVGEKLLDLNNKQLKTLELPKDLAEAVSLAQRLKKTEALRRQVQFIGRLMRELDEETATRIKRYIEGLGKKSKH